jgi:ribosome-interacting GTPase 1
LSHTPDYHIEKEGAGQVVLIGPANTGKSTLVSVLTNASPEISEAAFTTRKPVPGMMSLMDIHIQIIDTPSLNYEDTEGGLFSLVRLADLILLVIDLQADPLEQMMDSLKLLEEHHLAPEELREAYPATDRIAYKRILVVVNKCDDEYYDEDYRICCELIHDQENASLYQLLNRIPISAIRKRNFDLLRQSVFELLDIIRVYAKPPGKEPDLDRPFVLSKGSTIAELSRKVHRDFYEKLKSARVWGSSEFPGQMVSKDYILKDKDIVELRI